MTPKDQKETIVHAMAEVLEEYGWNVFGVPAHRMCKACKKVNHHKGKYCGFCKDSLPRKIKKDDAVFDQLFEAFEEGKEAESNWKKDRSKSG